MRQKTNENKSTSCVYQELNPEMDAFLAGYLEDGRHRGLRESTIHLHDKIGHYFLSAVTETGCLKPQEMDAHSIGAACLRIRSRWYLSHIRTFLRYAYHSGYTGRDYSGVVPLFKRPQPYPSVYTAEEILKIENSVDQDSPHGKRDYAALLLATRLGIRSGDISSMTFKELDFEGNLVRLTQHKTGIPIELPMVPDVKDALKRYLQEERSDYDSPYVFLRIVPPYSHISVQAITKIVRTAIAAAGIDPDGRKQGPHAFRSSLASSMVNDNIPYEVVRKTHTDQNAFLCRAAPKHQTAMSHISFQTRKYKSFWPAPTVGPTNIQTRKSVRPTWSSVCCCGCSLGAGSGWVSRSPPKSKI